MISEATITRILDEADVVDVIGDFVTLKRAGSNYKANCPFHNEKTPSFMVSPSKGIYKCFGCGKAGNSVKFIMEHEQLTYPEALRFLAEKYNIEVEETQLTDEQRRENTQRESIFVLNQRARDHFVENLTGNGEGRSVGLSYLKERGFREETIERFQLGYAMKGPEHFTRQALDEGFQLEMLKEAGLTIRKENSKMDFFRERVMFPIHSVAGKVLGFGGRALTSDKRAPKYLNTGATPVYDKSRVLYGMYFAKGAIRTDDECILVEGYTDVISLHQAGIETAVASSGTALTADQARLIRRFSENVLVLFDGDAAGLKAALRGVDILLENGLNVKVLLLPEGEDPDSYVKTNGADGFRRFAEEHRQDFVLFKTSLLKDESQGDPVARARMIRDVVDSVALIPDGITRSVYVRECADLLELDERILQTEVNKGRKRYLQDKRRADDRARGRDDAPPPEIPAETPEEMARHKEQMLEEVRQPIAHYERDLLRALLQHGPNPWDAEQSVCSFVLEEVAAFGPLTDPVHRRVVDLYQANRTGDVPPETSFFLNHEDEEVSSLVIDLVTEQYTLSTNWIDKFGIHTVLPGDNYENDVRAALHRYQLKKVLGLMEENLDALKVAQDQEDDEEVRVLMQVQLKLRERMNGLAAALGTVVMG